MRYFISDLHLSDKGIEKWERTRFETIQEHDEFILSRLDYWSKVLNKGDELWILGDWGNTDYLPVMNKFKCKKFFLYGNHDFQIPTKVFKEYFDEVYEYPVYLSQKLVVSHFPVAVYEDTINVHGHLHGSELIDENHITVSINDRNYELLSERSLEKTWKSIKTYNRWFLWEPWIEDIRILNTDRDDLVFDLKDGRLDVSASRVLRNLLMNGKKPVDKK